MKRSNDKRQELLDTALETLDSGLNRGSSGNISVREGDGFLITPSALPFNECSPDDMVKVAMDGSWQGKHKPSSEWRFHRDIYQHRPEAGAVIHAHPVWCTTLACLNKGIPAVHYMIAMAGGNTIRCAPYALFGTQQLSDLALEALHQRKACLLANHGLLCFESTLKKALALAEEVELLAQIYCQTLQTGQPVILDDDAMHEVIKRFAGYKPDD